MRRENHKLGTNSISAWSGGLTHPRNPDPSNPFIKSRRPRSGQAARSGAPADTSCQDVQRERSCNFGSIYWGASQDPKRRCDEGNRDNPSRPLAINYLRFRKPSLKLSHAKGFVGMLCLILRLDFATSFLCLKPRTRILAAPTMSSLTIRYRHASFQEASI